VPFDMAPFDEEVEDFDEHRIQAASAAPANRP
jgi:hypothetical protein